MRLFRHRQPIRKDIPARTPQKDPIKVYYRNLSGTPQAGAFRPTPPEGRPVDKSVDKFPARQVGTTPYYPYHGSMSGKEGNMGSKSHRIAMAQALLAELAEAVARHGDTTGTRRLRALVARTVAELLA